MGNYVNINLLMLTSMSLTLTDFQYFPSFYVVTPSQLKSSRFIVLLLVCLWQEA